MANGLSVWPALPGPRRQYILLSHAMGRALSNGHIIDRVPLERAMAALLGVGLCSPFHTKTLKMVTKVTTFGNCPLGFLNLLCQHVVPLQAGRWVLVVVDDLSGSPFADLPGVVRAVVALCAHGVQVLVKRPDGSLISLNQGRYRPATARRELNALWCHQAGQAAPQVGKVLQRAQVPGLPAEPAARQHRTRRAS